MDIIGGDINGLSTRIHEENEAKVQFLKQDQSTRYAVDFIQPVKEEFKELPNLFFFF